MKREIKFRAYIKLTGQMVNVVSLGLGWSSGAEAYVDWGEKTPQRLHPADYELMQFTGLKDKNGKEIYEGDVVKFGENKGETTIHKVIWGDNYPAFDLEPSTDMEVNTFSLVEDGVEGFEIEIIGNIYENPELLSN